MLERSGRKLFRSPSPLGQLPRTPDSSLNQVQAQNSPGSGNAIIDTETHITPSFPLNPFRNSSIADAETHKTPSFHSMPSYMRGLGTVQKKTWRGQLPKRRKILLIVLTIALLVPSYIVIFEIINAVMLYKQIQGGIAHLQAAETVFLGGSGSGMAKYFDIHKLHQAQGEIDAAHVDFVSLSDKLDHETTIDLVSNLLPTQVIAIRPLGHIATDC